MTPERQAVLRVIEQAIARDGMAPTFDDIRRVAGIKSKSTVYYLLDRLEQDGFIQRDKGRVRAITLLRHSDGCPTDGLARLAPELLRVCRLQLGMLAQLAQLAERAGLALPPTLKATQLAAALAVAAVEGEPQRPTQEAA